MPNENNIYRNVQTSARRARIGYEPVHLGQEFELGGNRGASLEEEWTATAHDNFSNNFARDAAKFFRRHGVWGVKTTDIIKKGGRLVGKGLEITYISHANTKLRKQHNVVAPPPGYFVPTVDTNYDAEKKLFVPFHPGTGIPHATVEDASVALRIVTAYLRKAAGLDYQSARRIAQRWVSYFDRHETYDAEKHVVRYCFPGPKGGQFFIGAGKVPVSSGIPDMASRLGYRELLVW